MTATSSTPKRRVTIELGRPDNREAELELIHVNREGWWYDLRTSKCQIMPKDPFPTRISAMRAARDAAKEHGYHISSIEVCGG